MKITGLKPIDFMNKGWLQTRFGDHQAQVSTSTKLRLRSSVKDVARVLHGRVSDEIERLTKRMAKPPQGVEDYDFIFGYEDSGNHVPGSITTDLALQEYVAKYPRDWEVVVKCLGLQRQRGKHACAFVIANRPIAEFLPMEEVGGTMVTQYDKDDAEAAGGLKMDFLVVNSLNDIASAIKLIRARSGLKIPDSTTIDNRRVPGLRVVPMGGEFYDIWDLPEDQGVFRDICEGRTETVFQFNTESAVGWLRHFNHWRDEAAGRKAIDSMEAMSAFTALDRPGPLDAYVEKDGKKHNMLVEYARRARGEAPIGALPIFLEMLPETYGVMCVAQGSLVKTLCGQVPIEQVEVGAKVQTETGEYHQVLANLRRGQKRTIRVRMTNGEELRVTADHRVLTARGWVEAGHLTNRDLVKQFWASDTPIETGDDRDWLIGLLLADGDVCASTPTVCCSDVDFAHRVKAIADRAYGLDCRVYQHGAWYVALRHRPRSGTTPNPLTARLRDLGIKDRDCFTKRFPEHITIDMLAGFFEGDGCTQNKRLRVKNERLARDFFLGLQRARIHSALYEDEPGVWTVSVHGDLPLRIKSQAIPHCTDFVPTPRVKVPRQDNDRQLTRYPFLGRARARRLEKYGAKVDGGIWGKVTSIRDGAEVETYDLSVESVHSFVVGSSVVHNCYQEQLQRMYQNLVGCSGPEAEEFRSNVAKKKMEKVNKAFDPWMERVGAKLGKEVAREVWEMFCSWGQYGFNKSHSVCYSHIAYASAYLKHHYPLEWWTAVLKNATKDEISNKFWRYCGHLIDFPEISSSGDNFEIVNERIRAPISLLNGIGEKAHGQLLKYRPYTDINDFCAKIERHCRDNSTIVKDKKTGEPKTTTLKVKGPDGKKVERQVVQMRRGHNALDRGTCYDLIVAGVLDTLFPKEADGTEMPVLSKLHAWEVAFAQAKDVKQEPVKPEYANLSPLKRFQMCKEVLPAYSEGLLPMIAEASDRLIRRPGKGGTVVAQWPHGIGKVSFRPVEAVRAIDAMNMLPGDQKLYVALPAYVQVQRVFTYHGSKEACEFELDVDGERMKYVRWPDRDGVLDEAYKKPLKGAVVVAVVCKAREDRPTALEALYVVEPPIPKAKGGKKSGKKDLLSENEEKEDDQVSKSRHNEAERKPDREAPSDVSDDEGDGGRESGLGSDAVAAGA